jgi:hypothetical protein
MTTLSNDDIQQQYFATVDFEASDAKGSWFAYGVAVTTFPSAEVLFLRSGVRARQHVDKVTSEFWDLNPDASAYFEARSLEAPATELDICAAVDEIFRSFPGVIFVSDNPCFDIFILDSILRSNNKPPVSLYSGIYIKPVCTSSFEAAVRLTRGKSFRKQNKCYFGPPHTPAADCVSILMSHMGNLKEAMNSKYI